MNSCKYLHVTRDFHIQEATDLGKENFKPRTMRTALVVHLPETKRSCSLVNLCTAAISIPVSLNKVKPIVV